MADGWEDDMNRTGTEGMNDVRRGLYDEASITDSR